MSMTSVLRICRPAAIVSPGWRRRSRVLGLGLVLAVGLSACVEVPPGPAYGPEVGVGVGFYQPTYPNMVPVPGYPVYYYPYGSANYFFYDGMYWLYRGDRWYSSGWYNGPWSATGPNYVPYYLLRVPVRYYRAPPPYFHGWRADEPPHWGEHWGRDWAEHHQGWRERARSIPPPAPLPKYQEAYAGNRYPRDRAQQDAIRNQNYHYETHDMATRPVSQTPGRPPYQQPQPAQPHQMPSAPGWQPPQYQSRGSEPPQLEQRPSQYQPPQQEQRPPQYQPPHEQVDWQQRPPTGSAPRPQEPQHEDRSNQSEVHWARSTTPPQPQPAIGNRQSTPGTPPHAQPDPPQHRESPAPVGGQWSQPAPQHPQATPPPQESSATPAQGQAKKSPPPPDKSGEREGDLR
jgi:hypothetical protein